MAQTPGTETPAIKLASLVLGEDLKDWVIARRQAGRTWVEISTELATATKGEVRLSYETLRTHFREPAEQAFEQTAGQEAQAS